RVAARVNRGAVLRAQGRFDEAIEELRRALALQSGNASAHTNLAGALAAKGLVGEAIFEYRQALDSRPDSLDALTSLAWILATSPEARVRRPVEAVRLAERASALASREDIRVLDTLAAACAAAGDFDRAVAIVNRAIRDA